MAIPLPREFKNLLLRRGSTKLLTTIGDDGAPHTVVKQTLQVDEEGRLFYLELMESSVSNRNMVSSLWFERPISILVTGSGSESWQVKGLPIKAVIAGPLFKKHYRLAHHRYGDVDLAAIWIIEPLSARNQSRVHRIQEERENHPFFAHLDTFAAPLKESRRA